MNLELRRTLRKLWFVGLGMMLVAFFPAWGAAQTGGSGSAFVPHWHGAISGVQGQPTSKINHSFYWITNITSSTASIVVKFYGQDGTLIVDDNNGSTGNVLNYSSGVVSSYSEPGSVSTITFDLAGKSTAWIEVKDTANFGYGKIAWTQPSSATQALLAYGIFNDQNTWSNTPSAMANISINGGLPF